MSDRTTRATPVNDGDTCAAIAAPLSTWLRLSLGSAWVSCYVWDRSLGHCLPVFHDGDPGELALFLEPGVVSLIDKALVAGYVQTLDPTTNGSSLDSLTPGRFRRLSLLSFIGGTDPLGAVLIADADPDRLAHHAATLDVVARTTLMALRGYWTVRQLTPQTQELQREKRYLQSVLTEIQQHQLMVERLTREVEKTKGHLEAVLAHCPVALVCLDRAGAVQSANAPAIELLDPSTGIVLDRPFVDLAPPMLKPELTALLGRALQGESINAFETLWPTARGVRTIMLTLQPFRDEQGTLLGVVGTLPDVTEDIRVRMELSRAEKLAAIGEMIAGVAHEMNNPLTTVLGYASLLRRQVADPEVRGRLDTIVQEAERTARIVKNLLLYARQHQPERRPSGVNEILDQVVQRRADSLAANHITVRREYDHTIGTVYLDPFQIHQALLNLVTNAEQALAEASRAGEIVLRTAVDRTTGHVVIEIADDGPGIPPQYLSRVFDPFFTTKEVGSGTGLGLSICYGIIREHGGTISVQNAPLGGAVFTVMVPPGRGEITPETAVETVGVDPLIGKRILVVDDEPQIRRFFQQALTLSQCRVEVAATVGEALEATRRCEFDLIVYDYRLPDGTGQDFAQELSTTAPALAERMLLITGDSLTAETDAYLKNATHVLLKPFDLDALYAALRKVLAADTPVLAAE